MTYNIKYNDFKDQLNGLNPRQLCSRFMKACSNGEVSLVKYMLDDVEINDILKKAYHGQGFLTACSNGQLEVVAEMLNYHNLNIKIDINFIGTPVKNAKEIMNLLVSNKNYSLNVLEELQNAFKYNKTILVKEILNTKQVIEENNNNPHDNLITFNNKWIDLNSILIYACEHNHVEMVKLLLSDKDMVKHADIHFEDDLALNISCHKGHIELIKFLLEDSSLKEHADIHNQEDSPLLNACKSRVEYFKSSLIGEPITYRPQLCVFNDKMMEVIKYLTTSPNLKEHANINAQDDYALIIAFQNDDEELVKFLLNEPKFNSKINVFKHISELKKAHFDSWHDNLCDSEEDLEIDKDDDYNNDGVYNAKVLKYLIKEYGLASNDPEVNIVVDEILENLPKLKAFHQYHILQRDLEINSSKAKTPKI